MSYHTSNLRLERKRKEVKIRAETDSHHTSCLRLEQTRKFKQEI